MPILRETTAPGAHQASKTAIAVELFVLYILLPAAICATKQQRRNRHATLIGLQNG
jgi:hypothetical protein